MGGGPSKPNNATSVNDTSVAGSIVANVRASAVDSASQNAMTSFLMEDEGLHSNLNMCLEQSNVDVSVRRLKQSAKIDLTQAQTQCMTTIITQIAHSLAKNLGSNDKASSKNYVKLTTDLFASAVATENISCSQKSDTSFVMRNTNDSAGLSLTAKQSNVVVSSLIATCMQHAIAEQTQTQTDDMTVKQTATSKAIGVKSLGLLGELESIVVTIAAVVITVALTCAALVSVRKFDTIARRALIFGLVTGYGVVGAMALLKKFSASFLDQDKALTLSDCDANIDDYDAAGKNLKASRPHCFCIPWASYSDHPPLSGFVFKEKALNIAHSDVQKTLEARYRTTRDDAAPIQAVVFVRNKTYEQAVSEYYRHENGQSGIDTPSVANFVKLQKADPVKVNTNGRGQGTAYFYTLPGGKPGPHDFYASCTAGTVGGIEVVAADAGMGSDGTGVRVLDDSGGANNQFTAMPYPVSKDVEIAQNKSSVSEQSWVVVSTSGALPDITQPAVFNDNGIPNNLTASVDVLTLPWMVSKKSDHPLSHDDAVLTQYRANLASIGTNLDTSVYPCGDSDTDIKNIVDAPRKPNSSVDVQLVDPASFPPVYNPDVSPEENFKAQTTNASNTPQWIYGSAVAVVDGIPITAVANTIAQFMVADQRTMLPYGPSADAAITYRAAVERKREACQQQMLVYLAAYIALLFANGGILIAGILPMAKSLITLIVGTIVGVAIFAYLFLTHSIILGAKK